MRFDQYTEKDFERIAENIENQDMTTISTMDICDYIMFLHKRIKSLERRNDLEDNQFYS